MTLLAIVEPFTGGVLVENHNYRDVFVWMGKSMHRHHIPELQDKVDRIVNSKMSFI